MASRTKLQERFESAQSTLSYVSSPIARIGLWPINVTANSRVKLIIYLIYHCSRTLLEIIELVMVFGNLQQVIENLMITGTEIAVILRVTTLRFNPLSKQIITIANQLRKLENFNNSIEMEIFIKHSESAKSFHKFMI
ncbi:uncharacterized protein [Fopius arisanus]|uniref:Uncharacterized protein n=1 Tax=Fopius arisanus TaxID=64838 RepID=A0A9R1TM28_9HYME|nr:PREDICTED: uncharacterized protein LOC105271932 [Fopius arisanus]